VDNGTAKTGALPEAPHLGREGTKITGWLARFRRVATWVAERELWLLAVVVAILLFSNTLPLSLLGASVILLPIPWLCRRVAQGYLSRSTQLDIPVAALLVMALVGLYPSVEMSTSLRVLYKMVVEVALFYGLVNGAHSEKRIWAVVAILLMAGTGAAVLGLVGTQWNMSKLAVLLPVYRWLPNTVIPFLNKAGFSGNIVGGALAMLLPFNLALFCFGSRRRSRFLLGLSLLIIGATVLLTQSRGALVGLVVAFVAMAIWRSRWFVLLVPLGLIGLFLGSRYFGVQQMADFLLISNTTSSAQGRIELWQRAIYMLQDFPYTGIGLGTFSRVAPILYPFFLIGPDTVVPHAHNLFLQMGVDLGIPGLVAFIALLTAFASTAVVTIRRARGTEFAPLAIGLFCGFVVYLIHGLLDNVTFSTKPGTVIWAILGLTTALWWYLRSTEQGASG